MNAFSISPMVVERLGWVLVHSLWQFAAIALVGLLLDRLLTRRSSAIRYVMLLCGLTLMVAAPLVTWAVVPDSLDTNPSADLLIVEVDRPAMIDQSFLSDAPSGLESLPALASPVGSSAPGRTTADFEMTAVVGADTSGGPEPSVDRLARLVAPWLGVVVGVWCCGVVMFSIRPVWGWFNVQRLKTVGVAPVADSVQQALKRIEQKLQIRHRVQLLQSTLVPAPVVVGCFQSVILLPTSFISGVPVSQLEAILAHELAHVRRYDYLVNLLQTLVETLFFYHPAVWWVSHRIRIERENCCDDLVVAVLGNKVEYGRALLAVEEFRGAAASTLALSVKGGSLLARVKRLFVDPAQNDRSSAGLAALGILLAMITAASVWSTVIAGADAMTEDEASGTQKTHGPESHGLQFRLVALSPDVKDNAPDLNAATKEWTRPADMTFGVELKNVSKETLTLAGIRYGGNLAEEGQGMLRTEMIAPHWFEFEFTDMEGKPVPRTHREYYHQWSVLDSASTHELASGQSLIEVLRPAKFNAPMDFDLPPGKYQVRVRYHGPDDEFRENVRQYWPDTAILNAWPHDIVSNSIQFEVNESSRRTKPEDLIWGQPVDGLQAALEYRLAGDVTENPLEAPGISVGTSIGVVFHLKNISDKPISFISETVRQGDYVHVVNERGEKVDVPSVFFSGWPIDVAWKLEPGEIAQLSLLTPGLGSLDQPGKYTVRYTVRFNSRQQKDDAGNVIFPRPGDYAKEVDTGDTPLFLQAVKRDVAANGEIHGRLLDDETGEPIRGATVACGAVINDSRKGGGANTKTDSMGNYRLVVPSPGIYNVWLNEYRRSSGTAAADDGILVEAGKVASSELRLTGGHWVKGKVVDQEGNPVSQIVVSSYSAARPQSGGVQSIRTQQDGTFLFTLPPGRVHVYTQEQVPKTDGNPFGLGLRAEAFVDLSGTTREETITLTLGTAQSKFGSDDWLKRSTPGTQILSHDNKADVSGVVVDSDGRPLSNVQVFKEDGEIVRTDEQGRFTYPIDKGTQFVMHAFLPGYHMWFGTPTAGDELRLVLDRKPDTTPEADNDEDQATRAQAVLKPASPEIKLPDFLNVMAVGFADDSKTLWSVSTRDDVRFRSWDVATKQKSHEVKLDSDKHGNFFLSSELKLSPDRTRVVGIFESKVCLWDSTTGKLVKALTLPPEHQHSMLKGLSFSADFSRIACGLTSGFSGRISPDSRAIVWDVASGEVVLTVELTGAVQTHCTALSADGRWLAAGGQQAGLRIWEVATGRLVHSIANSNPDLQHPDPEVKAPGTDQVLSLSFSPDGKLLAMADLLTVKVFNTDSGELQYAINRSFRYGKSGLVFSPDGQLLARVDTDKQVPIWSTDSGELVAEFPTEAHDGSFSPDGQWFAACFSDGAEGVGLWRLRQVVRPKPNAQDDQAQLPWRVHGRIVDADGKPLEGVTVRAATGTGTLKGGGRGVTDADGRYDFRFGRGVIIGRGEDGKPSPQTQSALISARLEGHFERNFSRHGNGIASLEPVAADVLKDWGLEPDQVCLPDKPREVNFVMMPAAKVSGTLVGEDDKPLKDYSVSLTGETLPPGSSVLAQVRTDETGRFEITEIPTTIPYQFEIRKPRSELKPPWDDSWASGPMTFVDPGDNDLSATFVATEPNEVSSAVIRTLKLKIVGPGVHGKKAVADAARRKPLTNSIPHPTPSEGLKLQAAEFTLILSNENKVAEGRKPSGESTSDPSSTSNWNAVRPDSIAVETAESGEILDDDSVQMSLPGPNWSAPILKFKFAKAVKLNALRLELLPDTRFDDRRLGRIPDRELKLFEVKSWIISVDGKARHFDWSSAQYIQDPDDAEVAALIDYATDTGWKVPDLAEGQAAHEFIFHPDEPISVTAGDTLAVEIDSGGREELDALARFRVSFPPP